MSKTRDNQICVNLTNEENAKIEELAKATRHKKSEIAYFIITDYLNGKIK